MKQVERVREEIAEFLYHTKHGCSSWLIASPELKEYFRKQADKLRNLKINGKRVMGIISEDQSLPSVNEAYKDFGGNDSIYEQAQQDMLVAYFVKLEG